MTNVKLNCHIMRELYSFGVMRYSRVVYYDILCDNLLLGGQGTEFASVSTSKVNMTTPLCVLQGKHMIKNS